MNGWCILTGSCRQLHGKLSHSHLHWQHNVINCTCDKSSISPSLPPTHHWSQPLFLEDYINFVTWSPYYYILHNLPWKPFLLQEMSGTDFHHTKTRTFCQFVEDYRSKWPPFPLILISSYYWDKKYPFFAPQIVYPPPLPLTPPTLLKRQIGA